MHDVLGWTGLGAYVGSFLGAMSKVRGGRRAERPTRG